MKYLLILLFLFSTHSFSGEIDGKGLDCKYSLESFGEIFWFDDEAAALGGGENVCSGANESHPCCDPSVQNYTAMYEARPHGVADPVARGGSADDGRGEDAEVVGCLGPRAEKRGSAGRGLLQQTTTAALVFT